LVGVMRRPPKGATKRPPLERPGSGYGRPVKPRPPTRWRDVHSLAALRGWDPVELLIVQLNSTATETSGDATVTA
jgi:hypothetical protein